MIREDGDLFEAVAFDRPVVNPDGHGGTETAWSGDADAVKARANFRFLRGGETVQAARLSGRQPLVATVRRSLATRQVTTDWRMRDTRTGVEYQIRSIVHTDDRLFLEMTVESGGAV